MRNNALYFPYISIPNESWTIKTLLYWDRLASIVPTEYIEHPEHFSPYMQNLVQEGLVEQLFPSDFLGHLPDFDKSFITYVTNCLKRQALSKNTNNTWLSSAQKPNNLVRIHAEKMSCIGDFLVEKNLAKPCHEYGWYLVEKNVARLFMSYLAICLGSIEEVNAAPVTNQIAHARAIGGLKYSQMLLNRHRQKTRQVLLDSILPVPDEKVTLTDLLRFKRDHGHLLPPFRLTVENHCAEAARIQDPADRIDFMSQFVNEAKESINEITDSMRPTWGKLTFGSIVPVAAAGLAWDASNPSTWESNVAHGLSILAAAYCSLSNINGPMNRVQKKPLAYVAHARHSFQKM